MNTTAIAKSTEIKSSSLQAEIIRQIQVNNGQTPCYGTSNSNYCDKKECGWRHDCFEDASEAG